MPKYLSTHMVGGATISGSLVNINTQLDVFLRLLDPSSELRKRVLGQFLESLAPQRFLASVSMFALGHDPLQSQ